jgi:hypothetical protein
MKSKHTEVKNVTAKAVVDALRMKKEIKLRVQNGENLRTVTEEKGLKVVLPL